ncbi:VOC family protein [Phytomonospora sp. NPDC050363]|uniref:VOC family protein n=1 Tax=Phytomonospora sp. NPDC050363 TaxID=3155642 RepID=UPI0033D911E1
MALNLFAGIPVRDYPAALVWYERFFGAPPSFEAHETEVVWELADGRSVYVLLSPEHAGHAMITIIVGDFDERVAAIAERGIEPATNETYGNGMRKATYRDPDGNEFGLGGAPV